jgi:hypothetical protein
MTGRIRVERALTLSDPAVGWVVISEGLGAYFPTFEQAWAFVGTILHRRWADTGVACRHDLHELCHTEWCVCSCHEDGSEE